MIPSYWQQRCRHILPKFSPALLPALLPEKDTVSTEQSPNRIGSAGIVGDGWYLQIINGCARLSQEQTRSNSGILWPLKLKSVNSQPDARIPNDCKNTTVGSTSTTVGSTSSFTPGITPSSTLRITPGSTPGSS